MIKTNLVNFYQLHINVESKAQYFAFYLYKDGEVQDKSKYSMRKSIAYNLDGPGLYKVKVYNKFTDGTIEAKYSDSIRFDGFRESAPVERTHDIAIIGVSRTAAFVAHVFEVRHNVRYFVDPTGNLVGGTFFGRPIISSLPESEDLRVVGHEKFLKKYPDMDSFSLTNGAVDSLTKEFHRHGAMDLYRISRRTYLAGLIEGSYYIQNFIFGKYNSRIPFKAEIGEGTRLGIGGIGTVIHPDSIIGKNCVIAQNVTLGSRAGGNGTPVIGDNVWISPGAKCFGGRIGNNVIVGANAVVLNEVEDDCVVAGVPAKLINKNISKYSGYFLKMNKE
ncbi:serine O-acetyltransferase [Paeniglutamicibacter sp. ORCA_105]|uniref:serine O-acetyltransferase n=1 Tax=Paeniglutamicibacter sp. ORCA_105 TaxID=3377336 RepID=UPI00389501C2